MTIARTPAGDVIGQVTTIAKPSIPQMLNLPNAPEGITLLTRDGRYVTVPASSVRLEEV